MLSYTTSAEQFWEILNKGSVYGDLSVKDEKKQHTIKNKACDTLAALYAKANQYTSFEEGWLHDRLNGHKTGFRKSLAKPTSITIRERQLNSIVLYILVADKNNFNHGFEISDLNKLFRLIGLRAIGEYEKRVFENIKTIIEGITQKGFSTFPPCSINEQCEVYTPFQEQPKASRKWPSFFVLRKFSKEQEEQFYSEIEKFPRYEGLVYSMLQNYIRMDYREYEEREGAPRKSDLVKRLYNGLVLGKNAPEKCHFIIGEEGTGKTTCMIKLYLWYLSVQDQLRDSVQVYFNYFDENLDIRLAVLCREISNHQNLDTSRKVLLLDELDVDTRAQENLNERLGALRDKYFSLFDCVVISVRSQFFQDTNQIITSSKLLNEGKIGALYYLEPFSKKQKSTYLKNRFARQKDKLKRARELINLDKDNVFSRPFLLADIEDVLSPDMQKGKSEIQCKADLLDVLTDRWAKIETVRIVRNQFTDKSDGEQASFAKIGNYLRNFFIELAKADYITKRALGNTGWEEYLNMEMMAPKAFKEADVPEQFQASILQSKAFLSRTVEGKFKFTFPLVQEFFIAKTAFEDEEFDQEEIFTFRDVSDAPLGIDQDNAESYYLQLWFQKIKAKSPEKFEEARKKGFCFEMITNHKTDFFQLRGGRRGGLESLPEEHDNLTGVH